MGRTSLFEVLPLLFIMGMLWKTSASGWGVGRGSGESHSVSDVEIFFSCRSRIVFLRTFLETGIPASPQPLAVLDESISSKHLL